MSTIPSKDQQIDALWTALQSTVYWVTINYDGEPGPYACTIILRDNEFGNTIGSTLAEFHGPSREEVIAKLIAYQIAERLT